MSRFNILSCPVGEHCFDLHASAICEFPWFLFYAAKVAAAERSVMYIKNVKL